MKCRLLTAVLAVALTNFVLDRPAVAQPAAAGAAGRAAAQARAQQRVQAQVQQRVQAQIQQRAQAQAQTRLQAEAARAARIAQQAAAAARQQTAAAHRLAGSGANARASAHADAALRARAGNQSAHAEAQARLGIAAGLTLPPDMTPEDVQIYDKIFGRFNPLRPQPGFEPANPPASDGKVPSGQTAEQPPHPERPGNGHPWPASGALDFAARIHVAMRHRRAEISQMRDRALATHDAGQLIKTQRMEDALKAFVDAQIRARSQAEATAAVRPSGVVPPVLTKGPGGEPIPRTASRPPEPAPGNTETGEAGGTRLQ